MLSNSIKSFDGLRRRLPPRGGERAQVIVIGHRWQPPEQIAHVDQRIDAAAPAGNDDRVNDGRALAGVGMPDEEPVFLVMASSP